MRYWKANQQRLRSARAPSCGSWQSLLKLKAPAPPSPPFREFVILCLKAPEGLVPCPTLINGTILISSYAYFLQGRPLTLWINPRSIVVHKKSFYKLSCDSKCLPFALRNLHFTKYIHITWFLLTQYLWTCGIIILSFRFRVSRRQA